MASLKGSAQSLPVEEAEGNVCVFITPVLPPFRPGAGWGIPFQLAPIHALQGALCCPLLATAGLTNPSGRSFEDRGFLGSKRDYSDLLGGRLWERDLKFRVGYSLPYIHNQQITIYQVGMQAQILAL